MHVLPKKMLRTCYMLTDVIIFVYEVPCIFWHYINVDEVSWITLKKIITKCDGIITNCDSLVYYKVRWTVITTCDTFFITKCDTVYYKLRQVLQSAMDLLQIATGITKCDDYNIVIWCQTSDNSYTTADVCCHITMLYHYYITVIYVYIIIYNCYITVI